MKKSLRDLGRTTQVYFMRENLDILRSLNLNTFGQLLIQQHIIAYEMASIICSLRSLAQDIPDEELKEKNWKITAKRLPDKSIEDLIVIETLGTLLKILKSVYPADTENDPIIKRLELYVFNRNKLTHNMITNFESIIEIDTIAIETLKIGDQVIEFYKRYIPSLKKIVYDTNMKKIRKKILK